MLPERLSGILLVDKPSGMTSHDSVMKVRRLSHERKIGHTGTLDPLAEGLLVMCLGKATKVVQFLVSEDKTYEAELHLGLRSSTYDAEGVESGDREQPVPAMAVERLHNVLRSFLGKQKQTVPPYSAVHVDGERLYRLARAGREVTLPEREIEIKSIRVLSYGAPFLRIEVSCGKGTYIRSLANDIGNSFGCGAYLSKLRRTAVGSFSVRQALSLDDLEREGAAQSALIPIEQALGFSSLTVSEQFESSVIHGRLPRWSDISGVEGTLHCGGTVLLRNTRGAILALALAGAESQVSSFSGASPVREYLRVLA